MPQRQSEAGYSFASAHWPVRARQSWSEQAFQGVPFLVAQLEHRGEGDILNVLPPWLLSYFTD